MAPKQSTPCPYPYGLFRRQPSLLWLSLSFCHIRQFNFANPAFKLVIKVQLIYYRYGYTVYQNIYPCYQASQAPTPAAVAAVSMWWCGRSSSSRMSPTCKKTMLVEQKKITKINLPGPWDTDMSRVPAAVAISMYWGGDRPSCACTLPIKKPC